jgi:hypothetical protein
MKDKMSDSRVVALSLLLLIPSYLTICSNIPRIYSPYSFVVVVPAFALGGVDPALRYLAALIFPFLFMLYFRFVLGRRSNLNKFSLVIFPIAIALSTYFNLASISYGIKYQGSFHTYFIVGINLFSIVALSIFYNRVIKFPTFKKCVYLHWFFFVWITFSGFPWLGELL